MAANGKDVSAMAKALTALFATLTPEDVQLLLVRSMNPTEQVNLTEAVHAAFAEAGTAVGGVAKPVKGAAKAAGRARFVNKVEKKKLRALNSFMAFRSKYISQTSW
jgi:hypothetical protein